MLNDFSGIRRSGSNWLDLGKFKLIGIVRRMIKSDVITFGEHNWQVLDVKDDKALIISESILELRWYHNQFIDTTWASCALRSYLNGEFYNRFSQDEKAQILTVVNSNLDNPWFRTKGGEDTTDRIFLLSLQDACHYFGDSSAQLQSKGRQTWLINDENNINRQARYGNSFHWWRLRSPGYYGRTAASINAMGNVYVRGNGVHGRPKDGGGVRPALWLRI